MEKSIRYKNHPVYYSISGKGKVVILLHGFAEDRDIWSLQLQELQKDHLLIVPDLPGSGQSKEWETLSMETMAEAVRMIMQEENIGKATLIGHSMGGYVTLAFAEKYPEQIEAFGLFHSTAYADTEEKKTVRRKSIEFIRKHGTYEFLKQSTPNTFSPEFKEKHPEKINQLIEHCKDIAPETLIAYYEAMMQRPDRTHVLKQAPYPVLFIGGKHDSAVPLADTLQQCHLPVFSYIHILNESGHMGLWEEAAESNRILKDFLERP